ncbi:hypothetical protein Moror_11833 [Moniliophthora roreri MCA 2997]|uniref:Uncharacterized protein n=2 Tax=Moniliophthora roreri TaxID=221103 RepID=V2WQW6_MONRO|nr:hypothetical protein Moror_11833 [Moniliophthora roreri MCA 2997]
MSTRESVEREVIKMHLLQLVEYQPGRFQCPSLDYEGHSSEDVHEHMLKSCKDKDQYHKMAANAKVEPDESDLEWGSNSNTEEEDDSNIECQHAEHLGVEAINSLAQALANLLYQSA